MQQLYLLDNRILKCHIFELITYIYGYFFLEMREIIIIKLEWVGINLKKYLSLKRKNMETLEASTIDNFQ